MKKLFVLVAFFTTILVSQAGAQGQQGGDPAAMMERYKERVKPQLIEKAKLTEAEADKVIEISFAYRGKTRGLRDLGEDERKKQMENMQAAQNKEYSAIPLTEEKIKLVNEFFEEQRKQMQDRQKKGN
jgi:hypothetical protein